MHADPLRTAALVNIGSVASDRALPLLGLYAAAKHAVKGYTDALRMELEARAFRSPSRS